MKKSFIAAIVAAGSLLPFSPAAQAGISLNATRVVYAAPSKEASVLVRNQSKDDVMIQSWLESDNGNGDLPFAITPSLSRLAAGKQQTLRIFYSGQGLPDDRESVFWLNVQEIPQKPKDDNTLQVAVRQRIKLFYRPAELSGKPNEAAQQLKWRWAATSGDAALEVVNDTPYYVSLIKGRIVNGTQAHAVQVEMVSPKSSRQFKVTDMAGHGRPANARIEFGSVNDFGGVDEHESELTR
ncbi:MAG: fimbria/pilus periplasmic chaperone [Burkholderia sp.]|jgi:P pilus assembly chaperone PapD|uniref:fimbrial biogenesis chaperone n=1 Tax=Burkholderia sp. TaxID=36773 RepID=UPI002823900F|nr:fimbria/pilus periplasmic chaperone [Burkholderia sp.]MDR0240948.1 fimbria/pilus periplasmic chaperone [Burkholderia sp.]